MSDTVTTDSPTPEPSAADAPGAAATAAPQKKQGLGHRLYTGDISYDFIGRRKVFYLISAILIIVSLVAIPARGLQFGIEFTGGADYQAPTTITAQSVPDMQAAMGRVDLPDFDGFEVVSIGDSTIQVQTRSLQANEIPVVRTAIADQLGINSDQVASSVIGPSWGSQISQRALIALVVFLVLVALVIWAYFRNGKMSIAALVALGHDLVLTVGIYALVGFTITPATLIGVLTILGYSLYDTVVVFDKVRENTRNLTGSTHRTYSEAANLAVNQVLVRSINTTVIGVLPVAALLIAGAGILGTGPLKDLALALFVGMIAGAYSSIFIATPILAQLKEREPDMIKLRARVAARRQRGAKTTSEKPKPRRSSGTVAEPDDQAEVSEDNDAELTGAVGGSAPALNYRFADGQARTVTNDAAAKRPQPQHRPRSERRKS